MEPSIHLIERRDRRGRRAPALAAIAVIVVLAAALFGLFGFLETNAAFGTIEDLEDSYICDAEALVLDFPDLSRLSEVYTADGVLLGKLNERNSQPVTFQDVPDVVRWALLSAEDGGFYDHQGVDFRAIARAVLDNVRSGNLIGGSTITQQLVKQNFLTDERTIERKICEAVVAAELERQYTKDQILEFYMNAQFFGENAYGVRAAAQEYWGKDLDEVTIAEAAAMVVPIRNPSFYNIRGNPVGVLDRRNRVIDNMAEDGFITMAQADEAKQEPLEPVESQAFAEPAPQVVIAAQRQLLQDNDNRFGLGATFDERKRAIFGCPANDAGCEGGGGLRVFVTVDFELQEEANRILRDWFRYEDSPTGAIAMVDNRTGAIKVVASGIEFGEDIEAGQRPYDLATQGRPAGGIRVQALRAAHRAREGNARRQAGDRELVLGRHEPAGDRLRRVPVRHGRHPVRVGGARWQQPRRDHLARRGNVPVGERRVRPGVEAGRPRKHRGARQPHGDRVDPAARALDHAGDERGEPAGDGVGVLDDRQLRHQAGAPT